MRARCCGCRLCSAPCWLIWSITLSSGLFVIVNVAEAQQNQDANPADEPEDAEADEKTRPDTSVPAFTPPKLKQTYPPVYPPGHVEHRDHPTVVVEVTLDAEGKVIDVRVDEPYEPDFDAAAVDAVKTWEFTPATKDEQPVASRVHVAVHFDLPTFDLAAPIPGTSSGHAHRQDSDKPNHQGSKAASPEKKSTSAGFGATATTTTPELRSETRSVSDFRIKQDLLAAAPRQEGAEILRSAPGLYIGRGEGDAVAHRIMLRGFDAEHGQDLELKVGGLPINLPAHIHGQGYADLGFVIPEVVDELVVHEGVYDPVQGDFAVAGSINMRLGVAQRGWQLKSSYGSFNTFRQLLLWAPKDMQRGTFAALQYRRSDGFGQNRASQQASGLGQLQLGKGAWRYRIVTLVHGARADLAGVLRRDDIDAGRVGFYDSYALATAQAQSALSTRAMLGATATYRGDDGDNAEAGAWLSYDNFRLQENFTGFIQRSRTLANVAGRGDLIEQRNQTFSLGTQARYRTAPYQPWAWAKGTLELGISGRFDRIGQTQNLLEAGRNQTWDRRIDADINGVDIGFWGDLDWSFTDYVNLRFGMRADVLFYSIDDHLGNLAPATRDDSNIIPGFRRSAFGVAWGPRSSIEVKPISWLSLRAAYGEGYRSPQARTLSDGEQAPFTKVRSVDVGARVEINDWLRCSGAFFYTRLSDDIAFEAREGSLTRIGATQRLGTTLHAEARPLPWMVGALSLTYVDAELLEPPPATAEDPTPTFTKGQALPYVPPVVVRADLGIEPVLWQQAGPFDLRGKLGTGFSFLSPRPLPFGEFADPVALLDASAGLVWGPVALGVSVFNLLDTEYAAVEFNFASDWDPNGLQSRLPARHIAAGMPRSWMFHLEVAL